MISIGLPNRERGRRIGRVIAVGLLALLVLGSGWVWWRGRPDRHLAWARAAAEEGAPGEALAWLAVPESDPRTREAAFLLRARLALERNDLARAVRALDRVDPHGPHAAEFAFRKGRTLYAAQQPLLAMIWLRTAWELRPNDAEAARWLAAAAYDLGDRPTAVKALEAVTRLDPRDPRVWRTLGLIFKENGEYERARAALEASLALDGDQPAVRLDLAETLVELGDGDAASRQLEACRSRVPEARRLELVAECCRIRGDVDDMRSAVDAGLAIAPDHPGLLTRKAGLDLADGHPDEALARLDRAVGSDPYRASTLYQRGVVLRQLGRTEEARRDLDRAEALNRGLAEMSALNQQADRDPHDAGVRSRLGRLCADLGKRELAASWYRAALACDPSHEEARLGLGALRDSR